MHKQSVYMASMDKVFGPGMQSVALKLIKPTDMSLVLTNTSNKPGREQKLMLQERGSANVKTHSYLVATVT